MLEEDKNLGQHGYFRSTAGPMGLSSINDMAQVE